jgi:hypothetical protein
VKTGPSSIPIGLIKSGARYGLALLASEIKLESCASGSSQLAYLSVVTSDAGNQDMTNKSGSYHYLLFYFNVFYFMSLCF